MQDFRGLGRQVWHQRYLAQVGWTHHIRQFIFKKIDIAPAERILEIGSGTSAVLNTLLSEDFVNLWGIDIDFPSIHFSKVSRDSFHLAQADGHQIPFCTGSFGVTFCHYLLMWGKNPLQILDEMCRATRPNGWVIAIAEPDHHARIDYPPPLAKLGQHQTQALISQGVDQEMGRKLKSLFHQCGLLDVEVGILGAQWDGKLNQNGDQTEWMMIRSDLQDRLSEKELSEYQNLDQQARQNGERVLYVPTFYALGRT